MCSYSRGRLVIVEISVDGATGTELPGEEQTQGHVAAAAVDVNGLAPVGRGILLAASRTAQISPGIPRICDATNDKIAHVADDPL